MKTKLRMKARVAAHGLFFSRSCPVAVPMS